jgi:hypothetical protein
MAQTSRPQLVAPRQVQTLEAMRTMTGGFDIDAYHVMEQRDNALIVDEVLHGAGSSTFVYNFEIAGKQVAGISVIGARHLASHYQGLKHRLVMSEQKIGERYIFKTFPAENIPPAVTVQLIPELTEEDDYYSVVAEMVDIKTGNSYQQEKLEKRFEERRAGGWFERPHYATIAQSKVFRNLVLSHVPQDIVIRWREAMLKLKKEETITASVIDEKRSNVLRFAAQRALALDRRAIEALTLDQIGGLGDAAREGRLPAFVEAARALGLEVGQEAQQETQEPTQPRRAAEGGQTRQPPQAASAEARQEGPATPPPDRSPEDAQRGQTAPPESARRGGSRVKFEA